MRYREIRPSAAVRGIVQSFWTLEQEGSAGPPQRVVPDGHPEIIFNWGEPFHSLRDGRWQPQPRYFLAGQIEKPLLLRPGGQTRVLGIRFHPYGAAAVVGAPMQELAGCFTPVDEMASTLSQDFDRALDSSEPIPLIEAALLRTAGERDRVVEFAVRRMVRSCGASGIAALANEAGLSIRQFERRFHVSVGLTPKLFCRIQRFVHAFRVLGEQPVDWVDTAVACGYYDQAHLIRDFKTFTGGTPTALLAQEADLARHFLRRFGASHLSNTAERVFA